FAFIFVTCFYFPAAWAAPQPPANGAHLPEDFCPRPLPGSPVPEPEDLRSQNGILKLDLTIRNFRQKDGATRYCYQLPDGSQSPTLRLHPGDTLLLHLKNELVEDKLAAADLLSLTRQSICTAKPSKKIDPCVSGAMTATSTNLHFHGLSVPSVCHQDDVLKTSIQPTDSAFEYKFQIPRNEAPGLYWYHPHIHGFSSKQVQGGASGALIVEGIERAIPEVAGLPERVMVIRDQDLLNPTALPSKSEPLTPKNLIDRDGDSVNNGTGFGKPAKDLSLNFVPVPYPEYTRASIKMKPNERQLWRVLNASSVTYLNLAVIFGHAPQQLGIVAIDGVPRKNDGHASAEWVNHIGVPPGARVEFIVTAPSAGVPALFVTRTVDTGSGGENDPNRALASITVAPDAPEPQSILPKAHQALPVATTPWLGKVTPSRVRKLYFSETVSNPNDPNSPTEFYITVDGEKPVPFDPRSGIPSIVVKQGDVEDWIIENRSTELHAFHIHQIHFLVMDWSGIAIDEPFLRDTVNVPYYNNRMLQYPSVRLRMDFRDPNTVGTFVYHCHLLEHEDGGMMGSVRVDRRNKKS
ncbi:MAG TPA: multicopper oxidase domain-containing protein, partial [Burkholderiaceae bacterium]|nr:multicopper oxidase domain-containing protein [Burkholderiaceae bacterium]